ncbi:M23 family metallopeptidase [Galactobacter sp.]|uniref:M23 family metallopeptidase n=1 Tax=Galactobacter sp. TaxID=2676125 RepID=UPI0025BFDD59|nr:M23 family metallopeptidase [Galactobacter sp.]
MAGRHAAAEQETKHSVLEQIAAHRPARFSAIAVAATAVAVVPLGISAGGGHAQAKSDASVKSSIELKAERASSQVITATAAETSTPQASLVKVLAKPAKPDLKTKGGNTVALEAKLTGDASAPHSGAHASTTVDAQDLPITDSDWVRPVTGASVTSEYGHRASLAAAGGTATFHNGIDFGAALGTPIHAANDGVVVHVGMDDFDTHTGGIIVVLHRTSAGDFLTSYNHMRSSDLLVDEGDTVKAGQVIAKVGAEGRATGPHLHFSTRVINDLSDPLNAWTIIEPREFMSRMGF